MVESCVTGSNRKNGKVCEVNGKSVVVVANQNVVWGKNKRAEAT